MAEGSYKWMDCDEKNVKYIICFESPRLVMKLPRDGMQVQQWTDDGTTYFARIHEDVQIFGQSIGDIYIISIDGQGEQGYIYSPDRGIVAVFLSQAGSYQIAIIESPCGYGAPATCYANGR
jgi:hypothetical protein